jgi:hypothetical protein
MSGSTATVRLLLCVDIHALAIAMHCGTGAIKWRCNTELDGSSATREQSAVHTASQCIQLAARVCSGPDQPFHWPVQGAHTTLKLQLHCTCISHSHSVVYQSFARRIQAQQAGSCRTRVSCDATVMVVVLTARIDLLTLALYAVCGVTVATAGEAYYCYGLPHQDQK